MSIDIVLISTMNRLDLLEQTITSMAQHGTDDSHSLTLVLDNPESFPYARGSQSPGMNIVITSSQAGASRARNIGASSIPKYRRQKYVMFCDDDLYFCPRWDAKMLELSTQVPNAIISGHAHPFNHAELVYEPHRVENGGIHYSVPLVVSTPHFMMPWELWDDVGYFVEPGGPGGSEDYDYCQRAGKKGYGFAVSEPQCVIHTGLTSSSGKPIVGAEQVRENNAKLEIIHGIERKVIYV